MTTFTITSIIVLSILICFQFYLIYKLTKFTNFVSLTSVDLCEALSDHLKYVHDFKEDEENIIH